jgi:hypothetical protein
MVVGHGLLGRALSACASDERFMILGSAVAVVHFPSDYVQLVLRKYLSG